MFIRPPCDGVSGPHLQPLAYRLREDTFFAPCRELAPSRHPCQPGIHPEYTTQPKSPPKKTLLSANCANYAKKRLLSRNSRNSRIAVLAKTLCASATLRLCVKYRRVIGVKSSGNGCLPVSFSRSFLPRISRIARMGKILHSPLPTLQLNHPCNPCNPWFSSFGCGWPRRVLCG
jgi:hypothetical protein